MGVPALRAPVFSSRFRLLVRLVVDAAVGAAKTRIYSNLKRFIKKQSRFAPDVPDFSGVILPTITRKPHPERAFPTGL
jgi:hypothetical protein